MCDYGCQRCQHFNEHRCTIRISPSLIRDTKPYDPQYSEGVHCELCVKNSFGWNIKWHIQKLQETVTECFTLCACAVIASNQVTTVCLGSETIICLLVKYLEEHDVWFISEEDDMSNMGRKCLIGKGDRDSTSIPKICSQGM